LGKLAINDVNWEKLGKAINLLVWMSVTNRFRLEQKSYLLLKLQFMSGFGKTKIFNGLLGNCPRNVFLFLNDLIIKIVKNHGRSGKL
jgi:hypothetical protein